MKASGMRKLFLGFSVAAPPALGAETCWSHPQALAPPALGCQQCPRPRPRPRVLGPAPRTWICPRVLLGEPGSTVGRLMQLMAPLGSSPLWDPQVSPPSCLELVPAPPVFIPGALANREPAPAPGSQSARGRGLAGGSTAALP